MIKYFVKRNFRGTVHLSKCWGGTCLSGEMLKGYISICRNAEGYMAWKRLGTPELVRDIINGTCYQRYEKRLEQLKGGPNQLDSQTKLQTPQN